jgi:inosose dehydratase
MLISRREILAGLAGGMPVLQGGEEHPGRRPLLVVQTHVWTQVLSARKRTLADGLEEIFSSSSRAGYKRIELGTAFVRPELLERTSRLLEQYRMDAPAVYATGPMYEEELAGKTVADVLEAADAARRIGTRFMLSNPNPKPRRERKSDAELETQARYVNKLGAALRDRGMRLWLHHHNPEMAENAREWRHLLRNTDSELAGICVDVDWVARGGQDPMTILKEAGERLVSLHLRNSRQGVWTESLDEGDYDYPAIAAWLKETGFRGYLVVELAHEKGTRITRPLEENLRLSRIYAEKVFGLS